MNQNIIRVHGDSLSMPRVAVGVEFQLTYPELLKRLCADSWGAEVHLYNRSRFGGTISTAAEELRQDSLNFGAPGGELLILQIGICDCAPRPIPGWMVDLIKKLPSYLETKCNNLIYKFRASIQKRVYWRHTDPKIFETVYSGLLTQYAKDFKHVYLINIPPSFDAIEKRSPGFLQSIHLYNQLIEKLVSTTAIPNVTLIDVHSRILQSGRAVNEFVVEKDGHHITVEGHALYAQLIFDHESVRVAQKTNAGV